MFLHPWVVNKEKEYFPSFKRIKEIKINNNNNNYGNNYNNNNDNNYQINNNKNYNTFSNRIREKDINCMKSSEIAKNKNKENENDIYESEINDNKENKRIINIEIEKKYNKTNYPMHVKNKSYCLVTNKSNSNNNGIYFIRDQSEKNFN